MQFNIGEYYKTKIFNKIYRVRATKVKWTLSQNDDLIFYKGIYSKLSAHLLLYYTYIWISGLYVYIKSNKINYIIVFKEWWVVHEESLI